MRRLAWQIALIAAVLPLGASASPPSSAPNGSSVTTALKAVTGMADPIWHLRLENRHPHGEPQVTESRSLQLVLKPFRSSKKLCRAYAIAVESPGVSVDTLKSYDASSSLYIARNPQERDCAQLSFNDDYFAVNRGMSDESVQELLNVLDQAIARWNTKHHAAECSGNILSIKRLQRIVVAPQPPGPTVRFWLTCGTDEIGAQVWRVFDVWLNSKGELEGYHSNIALE